ncbi:MAG: flippase-like domain-containing protein [Bacteroidia bacterium]|nr:flippase-like domain-containing protein [Bacteroidia bacterium]
MGERGRHLLLWAGKCVLASLLLYLLIHNVDAAAIARAWSGANPWYIAAALLLLPLNLWLQYRKWAVMLRRVYPDIPVGDVRGSLLIGFTFGLVTPARIGEFGGRAVAVRGAKPSVLMGLTAADKLSTMAVTVGVGLPGVLLYGLLYPFMDRVLLLAVFSGTVAMGLLVIGILVQLRGRIRNAEHWVGRTYRRITMVVQALDASTVRIMLWLSVLFYLTFLAQFFLLLSAFGPVSLFSALAGISTIMLIKTIVPPITLGELGIREGTAVLVLAPIGVLAAAAFNASLLLFVVNLLIPALIGVPLLVRTRRTAQRSS